MNIEVMREIAAAESNPAIVVNGINVNSLSETVNYTTAEMMTLMFDGGLYETKTSSDPVTTAYVGNDYWFIYKVTNSHMEGETVTPNAENAGQIILTDTIPDNFTIYSSSYVIDNVVTPVQETSITPAGKVISTPEGTIITRQIEGNNVQVQLGTLTIEVGKTLTVYVKVKLNSVVVAP